MKVKKLAVFAVIGLVLLAGSAYAAAKPEDALSTRPEDSIYAVLRLQDTSRFLQWVFSKENVEIFAPLFMQGKSKLEILAASEFVSALAAMSPIRSAAIVTGMTKNDAKQKSRFVQAALTFSPEVRTSVLRIEAGLADASDVAKLLIGDSTAANFAETMIKLQKEKDNIFRVNNDIFMAAANDTVVLGSSVIEVRKAMKSMNDKDTRLLNKKARRFTAEDFALLHADINTAATINNNMKSQDVENARKYFEKPLEVELAFTREPDKFVVSAGGNFAESLRKKYADILLAQTAKMEYIKGGHIDLAGIGGTASPLVAIGTYLDFDSLDDVDEWKSVLKAVIRNMRVRFGVADDETKALISGPFSFVVNDTVTYEGFKIPAVYVSQQGKNGAASNVYSKLTKSQHFSKVKDGILQLDSSISPVSCLVANRGEKLGVYFAELASLEQKPVLKPAFADLMNRESTSSSWIDFAGIQSWILDENNGVMMMLGPVMTFSGYGKYYKLVQDVLTAELSVPSMSVWGKAPEFFQIEFAVKEINPENGLFMRIRNVVQEINALTENKATSEDNKTDSENGKEKSK